MADYALDTEGSVSTERNGQVEHQINGASGETAEYQPLSKTRLRAALDAIPAEREPEMIADFPRAVDTQSREKILVAINRWVGSGDFYADPNRVENHPLANLAGSLKDSPELEQLMEQITLARCQARC